MTTEIPVGERIRFFREARHQTATSVAVRAGITAEYLYLIEKGLRVPSTQVLYRLATVLRVPTASLLGEPGDDGDEDDSLHTWGTALAGAMADYGRPASAIDGEGLAMLRDRVSALNDLTLLQGRYAAAGPLPEVVRDVGQATRMFRSPGEAALRREAYRTAVDLHHLVRQVAKALRRPDLMRLAAERALFYAESADDPIRVAFTQWGLASSLCTINEPEHANQLCLTAIEDLTVEADREGAGQIDALAVQSQLHLMAATAEGRLGDTWGARARIRDQGMPLARQIGEHDLWWTVCGPTNAALHLVSVEVESGEAADALRVADDVTLDHVRSVERRATFLLSLARIHEYRHDDSATLLTLLRLEREAPQDLRHRGESRDLVRGLLKRARRTFAPEVRELATRMGLYGTA
jgi:transcriptional regulator with XRE-family HTH domain